MTVDTTRCGFTFDPEYSDGEHPAAFQNCCYRETVPDADHCAWHVDPAATRYKTANQLNAVRAPPEIRKLNSPVDELLDGARLDGTRLADDLSLQRCTVRAGNFREANLTTVDFSNAVLEALDCTGAVLTECTFRNSYIAGADFSGAILRGADLHNTTLTGVEFHGANLNDVDASTADLTRATLDEALLEEATLQDATLADASLVDAHLVGAKLDSASFSDADLSEAELRRATATNAAFNNATLRDAECTRIDLSDAALRSAELRKATLFEANLTTADLTAADLTAASIEHADLQDTTLRGSTLVQTEASNAVLTEAVLIDATLTDAVLVEATAQNVTAVGADFENADLKSSDFSRGEFQEAAFDGANLSKATLAEAVLYQSTFEEARLYKADLTGASLREARFATTNLESAVLSRADLSDAMLAGARLYGAILDNVQLTTRTLDAIAPKETPAHRRHIATWGLRFLAGIDGRDKYRCVYDPVWDESLPSERGVSQTVRAAGVYRQLELLAANNALPERRGRFFMLRQDMQTRQFRQNAKYLSYLFQVVQRALFGYGERFARVVSWSGVIIFLFSILYLLGGWIQPVQSGGDFGPRLSWTRIPEAPGVIWDSIYYSTLTFTALGFGDFRPTKTLGQVFTIAETATGAVLLALLVFVLGRRAAR